MSKSNPPQEPGDPAAKETGQSSDQMPLAALAGSSRRFDLAKRVAAIKRYEYEEEAIKSIVERIQVGDTAEGEAALHELLAIVENRVLAIVQNEDEDGNTKQRLAELDTRQGVYLTASGTLTQFNAILAAVHGAALATVEVGVLKAAMAAALVSHVVAAFFLCWAARPVDGAKNPTMVMALAEGHTLTDDTFRHYRRGWRMTLIALTVSAMVAVLFLVHVSGVTLLTDITGWR